MYVPALYGALVNFQVIFRVAIAGSICKLSSFKHNKLYYLLRTYNTHTVNLFSPCALLQTQGLYYQITSVGLTHKQVDTYLGGANVTLCIYNVMIQ